MAMYTVRVLSDLTFCSLSANMPSPTEEGIGVPHPNQLALPVAVDRWIKQSHQLAPALAHDRLNEKIATITEAINVIASDRDEVPIEFEGLSVVDLMAAQASLTIEAQVALQISRLAVAA